MTTDELELGGVRVARDGIEQIEEFESVRGAVGPATRHSWVCERQGVYLLRLAVVLALDGSKEVRCYERARGPVEFQGIVDRLRLGIDAIDSHRERVVLKQARSSADNPSTRPALHGANWAQLDQVAGVSVLPFLRALGAEPIELATERAAVAPSIAFKTGDLVVPAAAYVITRVLPMQRALERISKQR